MSKFLKHILSDEELTKKDIKKKIKEGYSKIPLFTKFAELKNNTLFEHINLYAKLRKWTLEDLVEAEVVNLTEEDENGFTLIQLYIDRSNITQVRMLLTHGARLKEKDLSLATKDKMVAFLNYRPGHNEISILEFCSKRHRDKDYLERAQALILDEADTTDNSSSGAESISSNELSADDQKELDSFRDKKLKKYNKNPENYLDNNQLCLVAARGVHFSPRYFKPQTIKNVRSEVNSSHSTYSQSTLFDAGYTADDEVEENDKKIVKRHQKNLKYIEGLKEETDHKEKKVGSHNPPATRNKLVFDSLYYRFMQVYINSYSTLFNVGTIKSDFNFDTKHNPLISASWNIIKATMYSSGFRFEWKTRDLRKDPHYRRFTGKPKHPNMGYIDLYVFDAAYVRENGFDRQLMCNDGWINLSAFYRAEAEVIFSSMIPNRFHERRCVISLPSFDIPFNENKGYFENYGINKKSYDNYKDRIRSLPKDKKDNEHASSINSLTATAATAQATRIEKTIQYSLFKSEDPKAIVHDHGDSLKKERFTL